MRAHIARAEVWVEDLQLTRPYRITGDQIVRVENVFITLHSSDGLQGIGAACPMPEISGETIDASLAGLQEVATFLHHFPANDLDASLQRLDTLPHLLPAARAATDMALHDLYCKSRNMRVVDLYGQCISEMETSVTIGIGPEAEVQEVLDMHLKNGFSCIKLKIGEQIEHDIAMVHQIRAWGGRGFRLRVDANQGYDITQLRRFLAATRDADIELVEQPLCAPGAARMQSLTAEEREDCMADEDLVSEHDALRLIQAERPYGLWNIKLMKCGGISSAHHIASLAQAQDIDIMWGCNDESRVSIAAALHIAFASPATRFLDLDGSFDLARDLATGGFTVKDGKLRLTDAPGLGVSLQH